MATVVVVKTKPKVVVVVKPKLEKSFEPTWGGKTREGKAPPPPRPLFLDPILTIINSRCPVALVRNEKWCKRNDKRFRPGKFFPHQWHQLSSSPDPVIHECCICDRRIVSETRTEVDYNSVGQAHYRKYVRLISDNQQPLPKYAKPVPPPQKKRVVVVVRRKK